MSAVRLEPIAHPAAWRADDIGSLDAIAFDLEKRHLDAMENALAAIQRQGKALSDITSDDFAMPAIADELAGLRDLLLHGRGLLLVRGWPVDRLSVDEIGMLYWGLGTHFGKGVPQSAMGDRLGYVTDVSTKGKHERGYRSKAELSLHNDSDDIVGLLCIRQGKSGGMSRLASAMAVHNTFNPSSRLRRVRPGSRESGIHVGAASPSIADMCRASSAASGESSWTRAMGRGMICTTDASPSPTSTAIPGDHGSGLPRSLSSTTNSSATADTALVAAAQG